LVDTPDTLGEKDSLAEEKVFELPGPAFKEEQSYAVLASSFFQAWLHRPRSFDLTE
jgi:hypothetical protein